MFHSKYIVNEKHKVVKCSSLLEITAIFMNTYLKTIYASVKTK